MFTTIIIWGSKYFLCFVSKLKKKFLELDPSIHPFVCLSFLYSNLNFYKTKKLDIRPFSFGTLLVVTLQGVSKDLEGSQAESLTFRPIFGSKMAKSPIKLFKIAH